MPKTTHKNPNLPSARPSGSAYPRDFSFYMHSHGGSAGRYHFLGHDLASKCGKVRMLDTDSPMDTNSVPGSLRCKANGCKELWPNKEVSEPPRKL